MVNILEKIKGESKEDAIYNFKLAVDLTQKKLKQLSELDLDYKNIRELKNQYRQADENYKHARFEGNNPDSAIEYLKKSIELQERIESLSSGNAFVIPLASYIESRQEVDKYVKKMEYLKNSKEVEKNPISGVILQQIEKELIEVNDMERDLFKELDIRLMLPPKYAERFTKKC